MICICHIKGVNQGTKPTEKKVLVTKNFDHYHRRDIISISSPTKPEFGSPFFTTVGLFSVETRPFEAYPFSIDSTLISWLKMSVFRSANTPPSFDFSLSCKYSYHENILIDWLIDWIEFYAVSAIFQPCNGGDY